MWGNVGPLVSQTAFDNASAIRVCQPGPVAFQRANVSGGNRREINVRALPDFGLPRGFNILAAVPAAKIPGNTSRAMRARAKVSFVHAGFSRSAFWGDLRFRGDAAEVELFFSPATMSDGFFCRVATRPGYLRNPLAKNWSMPSGTAGALLEQTRQCSWSSSRRTHFRVRLRHLHRLNQGLCRVESSESVA